MHLLLEFFVVVVRINRLDMRIVSLRIAIRNASALNIDLIDRFVDEHLIV